ncbi:hypothetical protein M9H77_20987 [Catharanthus roseus]|uniref:Uncharacterized protein n=1 Tax=Catharanthus roseus TaxID=4058 RepID=A0ACC0ANC4_CATRO|nr:hypothetical protein M9H77_20987 [Catharanthus roseus]
MKGPLDRTKVVLRHLPPTLSQSSLMEQVDSRFAGRYNWVSYRPGKTSQKLQSYSRAYIDFKRPDDVIEFAEFFDGHVFVNEKGTQFKTSVEYAPSQRVPKQWSKKDGREGTILRDPEYLEFLEFLAKPVENLPSAEIQLERKEAERAGAAKDPPIVTPLMDYVRQKRAAKSGGRRSVSNGKSTKRVSGAATGISSSSSSKRSSDKKKVSAMYVLRDSAKVTSGKDRSTYVMVTKQDDQQLLDKPRNDGLEEEGGSSATVPGKKKILLLKGKEKEIPHISAIPSTQQNAASPVKNFISSGNVKQNQRREGSGRIIRSILLNKDNRQNQSSVSLSEQSQSSNLDKDKRPPRPPSLHLLQKDTNGAPDDRTPNDFHGFHTDKQERRPKNKERPDRGVWAPLRRSDSSHASDESLSSSACQSALDSAEGNHAETRSEITGARGEFKHRESGRGSHSSLDNGTYKHGARRGSAHIKDSDGSAEGKSLRRGGSCYGSHEKQVWVQKSSSGS